MAEKKIKSELYTVVETFTYHGNQIFTAGQTVQAGHPILRGRAGLFRPFAPDHPWPAAGKPETKPEPEPEPATEGDE